MCWSSPFSLTKKPPAGQDWRRGRVWGREGQPKCRCQVSAIFFPPAPTPVKWVWVWFSNDLNQTNVPIKFITNHLTNPIFNLPGCLAGLCHAPNGWIPLYCRVQGSLPLLISLVEEDFNGLKFQMLFGSQDLAQGTTSSLRYNNSPVFE